LHKDDDDDDDDDDGDGDDELSGYIDDCRCQLEDQNDQG